MITTKEEKREWLVTIGGDAVKEETGLNHFVIETYGGLGKRAQGFLNELSIFAIDHAVIRSRFDIVNGLRYAIACSVQRGNALIAAAGYANSLNMSRA